MSLLLDILNGYLFSGVPSNAVWDLIKIGWQKACRKSWEDLYTEAFLLAIQDMKPHLRNYSDGEIDLDIINFQKSLHQDLRVSDDILGHNILADNQFPTNLSKILTKRQVLILGGHNLTESEYAQFIFRLIEHAKSIFKLSVINNEIDFRRAIIEETLATENTVQQAILYLQSHHNLVLSKLDAIEQKFDGNLNNILELLQSIAKQIGVNEQTAKYNVTEVTEKALKQKSSQKPAYILPGVKDDTKIHMITIIFRSGGDKVQDNLRIRRVFGTFSAYPGRDRFAFLVYERKRGFRVEFPNFTTRLCNDLISNLSQLVGAENVLVEKILATRQFNN
jgi:uncharacterized protein YihD (DUF1040 family)